MGISEQQRNELASFLRNRRERLTPEAVGAHHGFGRRRTPGLRREEVAARAGVSGTWYTWLEQGRRINPSRQVLSSLAAALQLDSAETEYLFRLANEMPPAQEEGPGRQPVSPEYLRLLEHFTPLPAFIVDSVLHVHAWNQAALVLFPHFPDKSEDEQNLLRLVFREDTRDFHADWESEAAQLVAFFRSCNTADLAQPHFRALIQRLRRECPDFGVLWERQELTPATPARRCYLHPTLGRLSLDYVMLQIPGSTHYMMIYEPDPSSALATALADLGTGAYRGRLTPLAGALTAAAGCP